MNLSNFKYENKLKHSLTHDRDTSLGSTINNCCF